MKVVYGTKALRKNQKNFSKMETMSQPSINEIPEDGCYTLVVIDPDAGKTKPNDPRPGNYYLHWLVVNISGGDLETGRQIVSYQKPTPPPGTGKHEYIFQLYEQPCSLMNGTRSPESLANWSLETFLRGKNLHLIEQSSMFVEQ